MDCLKEPLKKSKPAGKVSPELKTRRRFCEKNRTLTGFWTFCLTFAFLSGLIFSQDALANLYEDCGLPLFAPQDQIERAWKLWRGSFHSDKHTKGDTFSQKEADKIFAFINDKRLGLKEIKAVDDPELTPYVNKRAAFYTLRDPTLRKQYDEQLKQKDKNRLNQKAAGNSGQDHASGGRRTDDERGNQNSGGASGRSYTDGSGYKPGNQNFGGASGRSYKNTDEAGLLHEAILSAEEVYSFNVYDRERAALQKVQIVLETEPKININAVDHHGKTALYLAAERAYFRTVYVLLSAGADPNIPDHFGRWPVHAVISSTVSEERVYRLFRNSYDRASYIERMKGIKDYLISYEETVKKFFCFLCDLKRT